MNNNDSNANRVAAAYFAPINRLSNYSFAVAALGILAYNFIPEFGAYLLGAGLTLGIFLRARIAQESKHWQVSEIRELGEGNSFIISGAFGTISGTLNESYWHRKNGLIVVDLGRIKGYKTISDPQEATK